MNNPGYSGTVRAISWLMRRQLIEDAGDREHGCRAWDWIQQQSIPMTLDGFDEQAAEALRATADDDG